MNQPSLFGDSDHLLRPPPPSVLPEPKAVRGKLLAVLDALRAGGAQPGLSDKDLRYWRTVFPQMSRWLPESERNELCSAFKAELARLEG